MGDGQYKIGAIIQARLGSTRLPNKVLKQLPSGTNKTVISQIINQINKINIIDDVLVATSKSSINDELENYLLGIDVSCFRGSEEDVLSRFYYIVQEYNYDYVLRFTGDNPIIDQGYLKEFLNYCINNGLTYANTSNLPLGCNFEFISAKEINKAHLGTDNKYDREHVTPFIKKNAELKETYIFENYSNHFNLRLTIDYPTDYLVIDYLFKKIVKNEISLSRIEKIVAKEKWILNVNNNIQKRKFEYLSEEIEFILPFLDEYELIRIRKKLLNEK